jgi:hypothetical protein
MEPITREQLKKSGVIEAEIRRIEQLRMNEAYAKAMREQALNHINHWIQDYVYEPVKRAAKDGSFRYMVKLHTHGKNKEYRDYTAERIKALFPDSDFTIMLMNDSYTCILEWD